MSLELLGPGISPVKTVPPGEDQRGFSRGAGETLMRFQLPTGQVGLVGWHVFFCSSPKRTHISGSKKRLMMFFLKYEYIRSWSSSFYINVFFLKFLDMEKNDM